MCVCVRFLQENMSYSLSEADNVRKAKQLNKKIIIIIIVCEFFIPALADGLSLESEWQQVTSSLRDSSQYSSWP